MNIKRTAVLALLGLLLLGCAKRNHTHPAPAAPRVNEMSLSEALKQAIGALDSLYENGADKHHQVTNQDGEGQTGGPGRERTHGLIPSEVEVVFQLAGSDSGSASGGLSVALPVIEAGAEWTSQVSRSSTNTITVRLRSILFARTDELVGLEDLTRVLTAIRVLQDEKLGEPKR